MEIKEYFSLIIGVLTDFKVIITVIAMLLVVEFAKFVVSYRKKPPKPKKKKSKTPPSPPPKTEEKKAEGNQAEAEATDKKPAE